MSSHLTPTQQRLRDLETLLLWEGELDNARLRSVFGVQMVQASRLIASFLAEHGDSVARGSPHAPVRPTKDFKPNLVGASPDDYLRLVEAAGQSDVAPYIEDLRLDLAPVSAELFALVNHACRHATGLAINYRSMTNPQGGERLVYPHALVRAARRWHVRAWCEQRKEFRDFALGRIVGARSLEKPAPLAPKDDVDWATLVRLVVVAHPGLSKEQKIVLRDEYLAGKIELVVKVRKCLVSYSVQDLRLATDLTRQSPPEFQLALKNAKDLVHEFAARSSNISNAAIILETHK